MLGGSLAPQPGTGLPSSADMQDWIGELANQLLGRLKNKLRPHGVLFTVATPLCMTGRDLRVDRDGGDDPHFLRFRGPGAPLYVQFCATLAPAFVFLDRPADVGEQPQEGDLMLF